MRYNEQTLEVKYKNKNIAEVLRMNVDEAREFFVEDAMISRSLDMLRDVGLGYLRLGQPATELSGGEAQRIKLATELQRPGRGQTLYVLDEPTTGLHPADVQRLVIQLNRLVDAGNTVIVVEHDMDVIAKSDWVIDMGPGAGDEGGHIIAEGTPADIATEKKSKTAAYLRRTILP
jgi:excinuclease ABC subunit A